VGSVPLTSQGRLSLPFGMEFSLLLLFTIRLPLFDCYGEGNEWGGDEREKTIERDMFSSSMLRSTPSLLLHLPFPHRLLPNRFLSCLFMRARLLIYPSPF